MTQSLRMHTRAPWFKSLVETRRGCMRRQLMQTQADALADAALQRLENEDVSAESIVQMLQTMASANAPDDAVLEQVHTRLQHNSRLVAAVYEQGAVTALEPLLHKSLQAHRVQLQLLTYARGVHKSMVSLMQKLEFKPLSWFAERLRRRAVAIEEGKRRLDDLQYRLLAIELLRCLEMRPMHGNGIGMKYSSIILHATQLVAALRFDASPSPVEERLLEIIMHNLAVKWKQSNKRYAYDVILELHQLSARCTLPQELQQRAASVAELLALRRFSQTGSGAIDANKATYQACGTDNPELVQELSHALCYFALEVAE